MKIVKKILIGLLVILVAIQFFHPKRNLAPEPAPTSIASIYPTGDSVSTILKKACYDCHSNNTRYPWYANIQPVAWWLSDHINEGKSELNFDEFATYNPRRQYNKLDEAIDQVKKGEMPLTSYTLIHTDARLTDAEKYTLTAWAGSIRHTLEGKYPPDSLKRKERPQHD